jgi:hypothetical protein
VATGAQATLGFEPVVIGPADRAAPFLPKSVSKLALFLKVGSLHFHGRLLAVGG